jgi:acyl carrier protein
MTTTADDARAVITDALTEVAPELDVAHLDPDAELTVEADLDSMDFLSLVTSVSGHIGQDIPERDYPQLVTLTAFTDYVARIMRSAEPLR